jgi:hypothetical protein
MRKHLGLLCLVAAIALSAAGCSLIASVTDDVIVGSWTLSSTGGNPPLFATVLKFTADNAYTSTTSSINTNAGTWSKSGSSYTLVGTFFGFISTTSTITPVFSNSNNTMTYTDSNGVEIFKK